MRLALWIAARYLGTRRQSGFITLLTGISIAGVALGVTALLTVLAVMNGFENEIQSRIAGTDAHVVLLGDNTGGIGDPDSLTARAARYPGVVGAAPFVYAKAMVLRGGYAEGLFKARDDFLRWVARRHDMVVPSLLADRRVAEVVNEDTVIEEAELHVEGVEALDVRDAAVVCPVCGVRLTLEEAVDHEHVRVDATAGGAR